MFASRGTAKILLFPKAGGPRPLEVNVRLNGARFADALGEIGQRSLCGEARNNRIVERDKVGHRASRDRLDKLSHELWSRNDAWLNAIFALRFIERLDAAMDHVGFEREGMPERDRPGLS